MGEILQNPFRRNRWQKVFSSDQNYVKWAKHYDYFDYIDDNKNIVQYEPDSDSDFVKFKEIIKSEWNNISKYRD